MGEGHDADAARQTGLLGKPGISHVWGPMAGTAVLGRVMWRTATVVGMHDETATARTITLAVRDWPGHVAGQHVDVRLTAPDGYSAVRSYSIASAPSPDRCIQLTVERLPNGEVSPYLTQEVMVGDELEFARPDWPLVRVAYRQEDPIQLVAGGSGIVPLIASTGSATLLVVVFGQGTGNDFLPR